MGSGVENTEEAQRSAIGGFIVVSKTWQRVPSSSHDAHLMNFDVSSGLRHQTVKQKFYPQYRNEMKMLPKPRRLLEPKLDILAVRSNSIPLGR